MDLHVSRTSGKSCLNSFYPFNFEQPMELSWDQVSVLVEYGLELVDDGNMQYLGIYAPKVQPFNYLEVLRQTEIGELAKFVKLKQAYQRFHCLIKQFDCWQLKS